MVKNISLITQSPQNFKGGGIGKAMMGINGAVQATRLGLLMLFFVVEVMETMRSFAD